MNEANQFYQRFINSRHTDLINSINELANTLVTNNFDEKKHKASGCSAIAKKLQDGLPPEDCPEWLKALISNLEQLTNSPNQTRIQNLNNFIIQHHDKIKKHKWNISSEQNDDAFDFDAIYSHYKSESHLPELFEQVIQLLEQIKDSGEIDSLSMINALSRVIATLKSSKDGSYFSMQGAWCFLQNFLKNYFLAELKRLPVLGSVVEALEESVRELNIEINQVNRNVSDGMNEAIGSTIKQLEGKSDFPYLTYDSGAKKVETTSESTIQGSV